MQAAKFGKVVKEWVAKKAEWEEIEAITITWSTGYGITEEIILKQIVEHAVNECDIIIICNDQNTVASYLNAQGISSPNIHYIETNFNSIWITIFIYFINIITMYMD